MNSSRAPLVLLGFLLAHCTEAPKPPVPWENLAELVTDSVRTTIAAYGERFYAADRDSLLRFYAVTTDYRMTFTGGSKKGLAYEGALEHWIARQRTMWEERLDQLDRHLAVMKEEAQ